MGNRQKYISNKYSLSSAGQIKWDYSETQDRSIKLWHFWKEISLELNFSKCSYVFSNNPRLCSNKERRLPQAEWD